MTLTWPEYLKQMDLNYVAGPGVADLLRLAHSEGRLAAILLAAGVPLDELRQALETEGKDGSRPLHQPVVQ